MVTSTFIDNAKVMEKGQVTIQKDGLINSAVYAMQMLQAQMAGEAEAAGIISDDDVMKLVKEVRVD